MPVLEPAILTIFGITGDLAHRKLLPSLYYLAKNEMLPKSLRIIGITRTGTTIDKVMSSIREAVEAQGDSCDEEVLSWLESTISIVKMDITDSAEYIRLKKVHEKLEDEAGVCLNRLFYLAIPSQTFAPVVRELGQSGLNSGCQHGNTQSRLLVEKPFGFDLISAKELIADTSASFNEDQIYRIDHYLAKETVQNILTFRFQNPLFSGVWDTKHISQIVITAVESIGIEGRVIFYEQMGALRDLVQSHLLQLLALVTMDEPDNLTAESIHDAKLKLLKSVVPPLPDRIAQCVVRAQYQGYTNEVNNPDSRVETFVAVRLNIDHPSWRNTPIFLQTGKKLAEKVTEIKIVFHDKNIPKPHNTLIIRIQPNEGISLALRVKKPGFDKKVEEVPMDFYYSEAFETPHPDAYERVIVDVMRGDKTLFATSEEVIASWEIIEPILSAWDHNRAQLYKYEAGSRGPKEADELLESNSPKAPHQQAQR